MIPGEITGRPEPGRLGIDFPVDAMTGGVEHSAKLFLRRGTMKGILKKRINIGRSMFDLPAMP